MALNADQVQKVRVTLSTSGWHEVMKPAIENRGRTAVKALVLTRAERTGSYKGTDFDTDDDVLRATIRDCEWLAFVWDNEISVADHNRRADELDRQTSGSTDATTNS